MKEDYIKEIRRVSDQALYDYAFVEIKKLMKNLNESNKLWTYLEIEKLIEAIKEESLMRYEQRDAF